MKNRFLINSSIIPKLGHFKGLWRIENQILVPGVVHRDFKSVCTVPGGKTSFSSLHRTMECPKLCIIGTSYSIAFLLSFQTWLNVIIGTLPHHQGWDHAVAILENKLSSESYQTTTSLSMNNALHMDLDSRNVGLSMIFLI